MWYVKLIKIKVYDGLINMKLENKLETNSQIPLCLFLDFVGHRPTLKEQ